MKKMLHRVSHFNRKSDFHCNTVQIKGVYKVHVKHSSFEGDLKLLVAQGQWTTLLGMDWFKPLGIRLLGVNKVTGLSIEGVLAKYDGVFG